MELMMDFRGQMRLIQRKDRQLSLRPLLLMQERLFSYVTAWPFFV